MRNIGSRIWPEAGFIVIELSLTLLHNVESFTSFFPKPDHAFVAIASLQLFILAAYVALRLGFLSHAIEAEFSSFGKRLEHIPQIVPLYQDDFFSTFRTHVRGAKKAVSISNLDKRPPALVKGSQEAEYFDQKNLRDLVDSIRPVRVRRLERLSSEKVGWIANLVVTFEGCDNFSLAALPLKEEEEKSIVVSAQIIDAGTTFLVDVARNSSGHLARDLLILHPGFAELWQRYFDDVLWERAVRIIENGKVINKEWQKQIPH